MSSSSSQSNTPPPPSQPSKMSPYTKSASAIPYPPAAHVHTSNIVGTQPSPTATMTASNNKDSDKARDGQEGPANRIRGGCIPCPDGFCFCIPLPCCC
ncbi:hypothetical protein EIP91_006325 [Steccherinum ochraceum]|uniref:Uncharacterized protein n=1 Tax=Steccherinum ochraceum TaxID=92696 RepID=A0A4R0RZ86_9APHY|nr:hypothetical protein EIP91_006325 [Steccherinum ochraceum]